MDVRRRRPRNWSAADLVPLFGRGVLDDGVVVERHGDRRRPPSA
jgi:hypothetical protein